MLALSIVLSAVILAVMFVNMHAFFAGQHVPVSAPPETGFQPLHFPFAVEGTTLIVERLAVYDGPFVEDGTDDEVTGIAALVLRNAGISTVIKANIVVEQGTRQLVFRADTIPPGAAVLVLDINRSAYDAADCTNCFGTARMQEFPMVRVNVQPHGMGCLLVTNSSPLPLYELCLIHKQWQAPPGIFVGGISYQTTIDVLLPGQTVTVWPDHYVSDYSRVVLVTTEKTRAAPIGAARVCFL